MTVLHALILGVVQGLGEFLPISSSAHLVLIPWLFGWEDPGLTFDVALHMGTLLAVVLYFWKDWVRLFKAALQRRASDDKRIFWYLVCGNHSRRTVWSCSREKGGDRFPFPFAYWNYDDCNGDPSLFS